MSIQKEKPLLGFWSSGNSPTSPHPGVPNIDDFDVKEIMNLYVIVRRGEEVGLAP